MKKSSRKIKSKVISTKSKRKVIQKTSDSPLMIKKEYLKSRPVCKVTFRLPEEATGKARSVYIVGDFNNWDFMSTPMKRLKNGQWKVTLELEPGREYRYRYLIDGSKWENDWCADKYIPNPFGGDDSVVVL